MLCDISLKSSLTPPKINILKYITCVIIPNDPPSSFPHLYFAVILLRRSTLGWNHLQTALWGCKIRQLFAAINLFEYPLKRGATLLRCCAPPLMERGKSVEPLTARLSDVIAPFRRWSTQSRARPGGPWWLDAYLLLSFSVTQSESTESHILIICPSWEKRCHEISLLAPSALKLMDR